ncbi:Uncharacterized protein TCM_014510 [Theobroma cacao]|uniref:DUF4283 domain-containing protein n=1 Tax=Theobroma cacao TaxID=3641 RepID=A0A061FZI5_THECC|nr:Uncharacterized protein TCM_014510 [Theobroma cacao]
MALATPAPMEKKRTEGSSRKVNTEDVLLWYWLLFSYSCQMPLDHLYTEVDVVGDPSPNSGGGFPLFVDHVGSKKIRSGPKTEDPRSQPVDTLPQNQNVLLGAFPRLSYRHVLFNENQEHDTNGEAFDDEEEEVEVPKSDEEDTDRKIGGPYIQFTREEKLRIWKPWKNTLIVKLLGRNISYTYLCTRVKQMWALLGDFQAVDLENGLYCFRFDNKSDYLQVLTDGPWIIADHYLTVRRWCLGFRSDEASVESVATWVCLPGMPLEYYDREILDKIGDRIGKSVKIDRTTSSQSKGKFARLCVEIDLKKPLIPKIFIGGRWQKIEYEGLKMLCFHCEKFGHSEEGCVMKQQEKKGLSEEQALKLSESHKVVQKDYETAKYGPWMVVKQNNRKPKMQKAKAAIQMEKPQPISNLGSQFVVLDNEDMEQNEDVVILETTKNATIMPEMSRTKKSMTATYTKEQLKENLQSSASVSNRDLTSLSKVKGKKQVPEEPKITFSSGTIKLTRQSNPEMVKNVVQGAPSSPPLQIQHSKIAMYLESGREKNEQSVGVNGAAHEKLTEPMEDDNPITRGTNDILNSMELESNEVVAMQVSLT